MTNNPYQPQQPQQPRPPYPPQGQPQGVPAGSTSYPHTQGYQAPQGQYPQQQGYGQQPYQQGQQPYQQGQYPQQGYQQQGYQQPAPAKRKSPMGKILAGILALALVAGGAFAAWFFLRPASQSVASAVPKDALGVIELDLNPAASDQTALLDVVKKFPSLKDKTSESKDYKKAVWELLPIPGEDKPNYDAEVKPWLGDSVSLAFLRGDGGEPVSYAAIATKDKEKAKAFAEKQIAKTDKKMTIEFIDDTMILSEKGVDTEAIKKSSLKDNKAYSDDMSALGGRWLATGWFSGELLKEANKNSTSPMPVDFEGHGAFGFKAEDGSLRMKTSQYSEKAIDRSKDMGGEVKDLPKGLVAFGLSTGPKAADVLWDALEKNGGTSGLETIGITSKDDFRAIIGTSIVGSGDTEGSWSGSNAPKVDALVRLKSENAQKAEEIIKAALEESNIEDSGLPKVEVKRENDTVVVSLGQGDGKMGDTRHYDKVIKAKGNVFYVDIATIVDNIGGASLGEYSDDIRALGALGASGEQVDDHRANGEIVLSTRD